MAKEPFFTGREVAGQIARNDPRIVQGTKALLHRGVGLGYRQGYTLEEAAPRSWLREAARQEGSRPFLDRRAREEEG